MANDFKRSRAKLIGMYLLIVGGIIALFSLLVIYQARDSFSKPSVPAQKEIEVSIAKAKAIALKLRPNATVESTEYEIENHKLYLTVSFMDDGDVKVDLFTGEAFIPNRNLSIVDFLTNDFEKKVGWVALIVFILSGLLCTYVANRTLDPIAKNLIRQKQFVSSAAHELRNPLAAMHARIESVLRAGRGATDAVLKDLLLETKHLILLSEGLLALEKGEEISPTKKVQEVKESIASVSKRVQYLADEKNIIFTTEAGNGSILIAAADFEMVLYNLLHNAIKFTPQGGNVGLVWKNKTLTVTDTGVGIPNNDIPHIFERFYKVDRARTHQGNGLGLAIVKEILDRYGAHIQVTSSEKKGTTFVVIFR